IYGVERIGYHCPLPANVLGSPEGSAWIAHYGILRIFKKPSSMEKASKNIKKYFTVLEMAELAEDFWASLNFSRMSKDFWKKSNFVRGKGSTCVEKAWNFCDHEDYRIYTCAKPRFFWLMKMHTLMGEIHYMKSYHDKPGVFRRAANPGFKIALNCMGLSIMSQTHLHRIGLIDKQDDGDEKDLNSLLLTALLTVVKIPYYYMMDKWLWDILSGDVSEEHWNCHWWQYRTSIQGVKPPVTRTEEDYDPGSIQEMVMTHMEPKI
ncbi:unnamed protein product, partial [Meganyctiphanes norvegica]